MLRKTISILGISAVALMASACQNDDAQDATNDKPKEVSKETSGTVKEVSGEKNVSAEKPSKEKEKEDNLTFVQTSFKVQQNITTLYKNEEGTVDYVGSNEGSESDKFKVLLRATGSLVDANINKGILRFITDDGTTFDIGTYNYDSVRMVDGDKYYVYDTDEDINGRKIVRIDGNLFENADSMYENETFSVDVKPSKKTMEIPDMKFPNPHDLVINDTRENDKAKITIEKIETPDIVSHEFTVVGTLELKEDTDVTPQMSYLQPELQKREIDDISTQNDSGTFYRNTKIRFTKTFDLDYTLGKDEMEDVYFTLEGELFAYNMRTGKEIKNPNITRMMLDSTGVNEDDWLPDGFVDVSGKRVYNAIQLSHGTYDFGIGNPSRIVVPYEVGGYNKLTLDVGASEKATPTSRPYDLYVYGADFKDTEEGGLSGTVLAKKTITKDTPLEEMTVDIKGQSNVYLFVDTGIKSGEEEDKDENFLPIIFSNVTLEK